MGHWQGHYVNKKSIEDPDLYEAANTEKHHDHPLVWQNGVIRWKPNKEVFKLMNEIDLNYLMRLFYAMGYDKNSEVVRKLYRDMGVTLFCYWETFIGKQTTPKPQSIRQTVTNER